MAPVEKKGDKVPTDQKNFKLGVLGVQAYELWCQRKALDPKQAFLGGWLALTRMSPNERDALFARVIDWVNEGYKIEDTGGAPAGERGDSASSKGPKPERPLERGQTGSTTPRKKSA